MIYYYYRSKEDIYNEVLKDVVSTVVRNLNNIPETTVPSGDVGRHNRRLPGFPFHQP